MKKRKKNSSMLVHRSGAIYIVLSIVLGVIAINGGNNVHYLAAAVMLGYMFSSGVAGQRNLQKVEVSFSLPEEIYAATPFVTSVEVTNPGRRSIFLISLEWNDEKIFIPSLRPGERYVQAVGGHFAARGMHPVAELGQATVSSTLPFNLFTRYRTIDFLGDALVFPAPIEPDDIDAPLPASGSEEGSAARRTPLSERDIIGVRPYVEGDPMKLVHWKSTARTGKLQSRIYEDAAAGQIIDVGLLYSRFGERGLSIASGALRHSIAAGSSVGILDGDEAFAPSSARRDKLAMLRYLAQYGSR